MGYQDDFAAALARIQALERELAEAAQMIARLRFPAAASGTLQTTLEAASRSLTSRREFNCRDAYWAQLEELSKKEGCSIDFLLDEAVHAFLAVHPPVEPLRDEQDDLETPARRVREEELTPAAAGDRPVRFCAELARAFTIWRARSIAGLEWYQSSPVPVAAGDHSARFMGLFTSTSFALRMRAPLMQTCARPVAALIPQPSLPGPPRGCA